jgi:hypothetical protein
VDIENELLAFLAEPSPSRMNSRIARRFSFSQSDLPGEDVLAQLDHFVDAGIAELGACVG